MAAATDFLQSSTNNWRGALPHAAVSSRIAATSAKSYAALRAARIADYQGLFNRFSLNLNDSIGKGGATDVRRQSRMCVCRRIRKNRGARPPRR